jgi:hypothetical protein
VRGNRGSFVSELLHALSALSASTRCRVAVRAVTSRSATVLSTILLSPGVRGPLGRMRAVRGLTTVLLERASILLYNVPEGAALPPATAAVLLDNPLLDEPEHSLCAARPHAPHTGLAAPGLLNQALARWLLLCCALQLTVRIGMCSSSIHSCPLLDCMHAYQSLAYMP